MYFEDTMPKEFNISPNKDLVNAPILMHPDDLEKFPTPENPLKGKDLETFINRIAKEIALSLNLKKV